MLAIAMAHTLESKTSSRAGFQFNLDQTLGARSVTIRRVQKHGDAAGGYEKRMLTWYGGSYNPDDIDELMANLAVGLIAKRRHAGKIADQRRRPA